MECSDKCRFCSVQHGDKKYKITDTPIMENESYYLLSSIGALIEGWTLVIPKTHEYSMKKHYSDSKFYEFVNQCVNIIKKAYGVDKVIVFEHGANQFGSLTACGTNHCHIHIVPLKESLLKDIDKIFDWEKLPFNQVENYVKNSEYLLYADVEGDLESSECYVHLLKEPVSQFFRRIIADKLGCPDKYNYKENENIDISNSTVKTLQKEIGNGKNRY